ncbi:MAG: hypothetical protein AB1Z23_13080 [Eubacteriales bacterium]
MKKLSLFLAILMLVLMFSSCHQLDVLFGSDNAEEFSDDLRENMQGFWFLTGINGNINEDMKQQGIAMQVEGEIYSTYIGFEIEVQNKYLDISEDDTLKYSIGGMESQTNVIFDKKDGYTLMILESLGDTLIFEKTSIDTFNLYKGMTDALPELIRNGNTVYLSESLSDAQLRFYVSDMYWFELYFMCSDGSTAEMLENDFILYSDGTGIDEFSDSTEYVTWEVESGFLYIYYDDGSIFYAPVDYAYDAATGYVYLYLYDQNEGYEGCAWIYYNYIE